GAVLANPVMVFLGLLSYSLYLWHWPMLAFSRYWLGLELPVGVRIAILVASLFCAIASWRFIETPFRRNLTDVALAKLAGGALVSAMLVIGASLWIYADHGIPSRLPERARTLAAPMDDPRDFVVTEQAIHEGELPALGVPRSEKHPIHFIVWGDSH